MLGDLFQVTGNPLSRLSEKLDPDSQDILLRPLKCVRDLQNGEDIDDEKYSIQRGSNIAECTIIYLDLVYLTVMLALYTFLIVVQLRIYGLSRHSITKAKVHILLSTWLLIVFLLLQCLLDPYVLDWLWHLVLILVTSVLRFLILTLLCTYFIKRSQKLFSKSERAYQLKQNRTVIILACIGIGVVLIGFMYQLIGTLLEQSASEKLKDEYLCVPTLFMLEDFIYLIISVLMLVTGYRVVVKVRLVNSTLAIQNE